MPDNKHKNSGTDRTRSVGMNKRMVLASVFILLGNYLFSQTYTTRTEHWDMEWKMLSNEEWQRLLKQKEATYTDANISFTDVLEIKRTAQVIKGSRPKFSGYYYMIGTLSPRTDAAKNMIYVQGYSGTTLLYGNAKTGQMEITFLNSNAFTLGQGYAIGYSDYNRRLKQVMDWVDGK